MYQVFNMGHRMEIYVRPEVAEKVIALSKSFNIDAQVVGHIEEGKKSLAYNLVFRAKERTLKAEEVNESVERIKTSLNDQYGIVLRS